MRMMYLVNRGVMPEGRAKDVVKVVSDSLAGVANVEHKLPMLYKVSGISEPDIVLAKMSFEDSDIDKVLEKMTEVGEVLKNDFGMSYTVPTKMGSDDFTTTHRFDLTDADNSMWSGLFEEN